MPDTPALRITDLAFRYDHQPRWTVLVPHLELGAGEQMLITGPSGRGKTTLLYLIAGLLDPTRGRVDVAGENVHARRGAARDTFRGRHIGMIFQSFNLLHGFTAAENVMAALMFSEIPRREHRTRALTLLAHLGLDDPDAPVDALSAGQQQRVAVARALACEPVLVLADEPTASLDPTAGRVAMDLIQSACRHRGAALLCTSHDPDMGRRFERAVALAPPEPAQTGESRWP